MEEIRSGPDTAQRSARSTTAVACEACRKMKMKCIRTEPNDTTGRITNPCERCRRSNRICKIPEPRPLGRKKGAVGRYQGFDKAVRKLRSELKKAKMEPEVEILQEIAHLPNEERSSADRLIPNEQPDKQASSPYTSRGMDSEIPVNLNPRALQEETRASDDFSSDHNEEPISNPLALLADASDAARAMHLGTIPTRNTSGQSGPSTNQNLLNNRGIGHLLHRPGYVSLGLQLSRESLERGLDALSMPAHNTDRYANYFKRPVQDLNQDTGPELDPVDLGLITIEEAQGLFPIYFNRLHPINGILDPVLHTPEFVRSRSALLFTWVLALTAQFDHDSASIAKRLRLHGEKLSKHVHTCGFKSVEIVQGYYISLLSATPAETLAEERSWLYTMYAFGVAAELGLDQYLDNPNSRSLISTHDQNQTLFAPEWHSEETETQSDTAYSRRLIRNRERTWFRILLWERANSAAYGRIHSFPETSLTRDIEGWWMHPLADFTDRHTSAFIALRQNLASLNGVIRDRSTTPRADLHWVRNLVDNALEPWYNTWLAQSATSSSCSAEQLSNTFLRYVYMHGRLWTLSIALNSSQDHSSEAGLRNDCFEAAINACEVAVRDLEAIGEPLYCMLAPTWAMISYAAVLSLKLFPRIYGSRSGSQVELFALLSQVALQLQRAGRTPSHRYGIAALLGQHIMMILKAKCATLRDNIEVESSQSQSYIRSHHQLDSGPDETGRSNHSLVSDYDPFLTDIDVAADLTEEGFTDLFREIFGPSFGCVF
ncbi:hypothetical protein N7478_010828 [Penicillium angulare]|uniref:uncharacterized protein n=1 Tax=Penicillium angulare TaxID=116970 RepID=UPI00253FFE24|nr:uncharacterized protein N7478_010828 [Penicillium angulare]KAJ5263223.1 hypothetical protein N7478_010828 [Penicillium angulare]